MNRKRGRIAALASLSLLACAFTLNAVSPVVTNVFASQRAGTKLVDITYDVLDADGDVLKVRVELSDNGGRTYNVPALTLSGDIGANIVPGTNKVIVWNAGADWDGEYSPQMVAKVIASDGQGLPELEWGREVPPGGFLMGQDGGPEGFGPSRHVNIPWSFWLSQYEITTSQYADYLNMALVAGEVVRGHRNVPDQTENAVHAKGGIYAGVPTNAILCMLGADIRWNIDKFVAVAEATNMPVQVSWFGALAFAQHYQYDLPTDAEWEKAARGFDHDGGGEHLIYPWGNTINSGNANFLWSSDPYDNNQSPVGYFNGTQTPPGADMTNGYGLYDMIGNVSEWTRTSEVSLDDYPSTESLTNAVHSLTDPRGRITRGGNFLDMQTSSNLKCYGRYGRPRTAIEPFGFRVVRREAMQ